MISDLEMKDFGTIFEVLFHDKAYSSKIRAFINNGNKKNNCEEKGWAGYAIELASFLAGMKENPFWDSQLPGCVPTLRKRFLDIKSRRNHARP